ncbi:MAG: dihydrolipoyl dehydrogenase [Propionibacteriaceae bacterium]|jgi:dihydrolipoamide dehydrogenase|nr:dihydrolipoyl dehydrogenase [Propionibacteriaceae bacterium]
MSDYDVIVIGAGPGGYLAAERLGHAKKKVLLAERQALGGTCLNIGCIPTKSLLNSAKLYAHAKDAARFGVDAPGASFDWTRVQAWKTEVVNTLVGGVEQAEKRAGVEVVNAHANLVGPGVVEVNGVQKTAEHVIIATGSAPVIPPIPGVASNPAVVDSTGLLAVAEVPQRLAVIGGGVIGVEFASLFAAFGTQVEIIEMLPEILPFADKDIAKRIRLGMKNVTFRLGCKVEGVQGTTVIYTDAKGGQRHADADLVLMAVGRRPVVDGWGAETAGLAVSPRGVEVDDTMRANLPNVWALGDVTGRSLLAHGAYRMAEVAVANILDPQGAAAAGQVFRAESIPWAVYSIPEAAGVGLTEAQAKEQGLDVVTATVPLVLSGRFVAENGLKTPGSVKIIAERDSGVIRGIHMLGPYAPETIWGAATVLETELTVADLRQIVFPHPTVSEGIREAAWAVKL